MLHNMHFSFVVSTTYYELGLCIKKRRAHRLCEYSKVLFIKMDN